MTNGVGAWSVLPASVECAALLEHREHAAPLYPLVRQLMAEGAVLLWDQGLVEKAAGIAAAAGGAWEASEAHFESALRMADGMPHPVEQPEVRRWYAWMLLDRCGPGDRERARVLLTEARSGYERVVMPKHVEMADRMLKGIS